MWRCYLCKRYVYVGAGPLVYIALSQENRLNDNLSGKRLKGSKDHCGSEGESGL